MTTKNKFSNIEGLTKVFKRSNLHLTPALPENLRHEAYAAAAGPLSNACDSLREVLRQMHRADRPDLVAKIEATLKEFDGLAIEFGVRTRQ